MKRDFSGASKQRILSLINQADSETMPDISAYIGNRCGTCYKWINKLGLNIYFYNVDSYQSKVGKKNAAARRTADIVFHNAALADSEYQKKLVKLEERMKGTGSQIIRLNDAVKPQHLTLTSFLDAISSKSKFVGKHGEIEELTVGGNVASYLKTLLDMVDPESSDTTDITSSLLSLFNSSASVETGIYKYYEKTLHPYEALKLNGKFGNFMSVLSLFSEIAKLSEEGIDTYKVFVDPESSRYDLFAQGIKMTNATFDFGAQSYILYEGGQKMLQFLDKTEGIKKPVNQILSTDFKLTFSTSEQVTRKIKNGLMAVAVVDVICSTGYGLVKRAGEVSADGEIDINDICSIGVHGSLSGLDKTLSSLTLGVVQFDSEQVAEELESEVQTFVESDDPLAKYIRDKNQPDVFRMGASLLQAGRMVGEKAVQLVGETVETGIEVISTVADWIGTGLKWITGN